MITPFRYRRQGHTSIIPSSDQYPRLPSSGTTSPTKVHYLTMQLIRAAHKPNTASKQPTETFTGTVHMDPIFTADDCMGNNVCFTPGARTFWHTHERGQILTVTIGTGFVCSKGEAPRKLLVGDVVHIPAGETHWHGATNNTIMAHTAISLGSESLCHWFR
jgi:quercetin dioxygenase-like cupin family protein